MDHGVSYNAHCSCEQKECPIFGNCVLCMQNHLDQGDHLPECVQNMLRPEVIHLAQLLELKTSEKRPGPDQLKALDAAGLIARSIARHHNPKGETLD